MLQASRLLLFPLWEKESEGMLSRVDFGKSLSCIACSGHWDA
jgi:hypothetical protein